MKYSLSSKAPPAIVGKALPVRIRLRGTKATKRPLPYLTNKRGVLPMSMKTSTRIRLRPVSI